MARDQKIGLALGILLIGAVGALFFRNEPASSPETPSLVLAPQIDEEISRKDRRPYLPPPAPANLPPKPDFSFDLDGDHDPLHRDETLMSTGDPREPLPDTPRVSDELRVPDPLPDGFSQSDLPPLIDEAPLSIDSKSTAPVAAPQMAESTTDRTHTMVRTHLVKKGETLSSLASKYFGSERRFGELYEANKGLLKGPHDLKPGMRLVIPDGAASRSAQTLAVDRTAQSAPANVPPADREAANTKSNDMRRPFDGVHPGSSTPGSSLPGGSKMFLPVRRNTAKPRLDGRQSDAGEAAPSDVAGRRLSQSPPDVDQAIR